MRADRHFDTECTVRVDADVRFFPSSTNEPPVQQAKYLQFFNSNPTSCMINGSEIVPDLLCQQ